MSFVSSLFGRSNTPDPRATHQLYRVPVTIVIEIPVAAPSPELAADPAVVSAALPHIFNDLESAIGASGEISVSVGVPTVVNQMADLRPAYHSALPYEHPSHPTTQDLDCREWLQLPPTH